MPPTPVRASALPVLSGTASVARNSATLDARALALRLDRRPRFVLLSPSGEALVAAGAACRFQASGPERWREARRWLEGLARAARYGRGVSERSLVAIGAFAFDPASCEEWRSAGASLWIPEEVHRFGPSGAVRRTTWEAVDPPPGPGLDPRELAPEEDRSGDWSGVTWSRGDWERAVETALRRIREGVLEKVVLARSRVLPEAAPAPETFSRLAKCYPSGHRFWLSREDGSDFLGASPERVISLRAGRVEADAVAGTARAEDLDRSDLKRALLEDPKERREHDAVTRGVLASLRPVCPDATVEGAPFVERHGHVLHLRTRIVASGRPGLHALDLLERIHPSPAVGGCPRQPALELIRTWEPRPRGLYAGAIGWLDGSGQGELTLGIRSALVRGSSALLYAGAGIVSGSDPEREWEECESKLRVMEGALRHD